MNTLNTVHISEPEQHSNPFKERTGLSGTCSDIAKVQGWNNSLIIERIILSQRQNLTCLPFRLGLSESEYMALRHYWHLGQNQNKNQGENRIPDRYWDVLPGDDLRQELLEMRWEETVDIRNLLKVHRRGCEDSELWMSAIVAAGCLGGDHLWRDLGLENREMLSKLLDLNFPQLSVKNSGDMKWKKFFYKQLCDQQGSYVCRAPSCDQCATYSACFGPET